MKRVSAIAAAVSLALGVAIPASAGAQQPAPRTGGWIVCHEVATVQIQPGLTLFPKPARFSGSDVLSDCISSDPSIHGGTATIRAWSAAASCQLSVIDGVANIRWDNGRRTRVQFSGAIAGGVAAARGTVTGGSEFRGQPFAAADTPPGPDPEAPGACLSPEGLKTAAITGYMSIGLPIVDGVPRR